MVRGSAVISFITTYSNVVKWGSSESDFSGLHKTHATGDDHSSSNKKSPVTSLFENPRGCDLLEPPNYQLPLTVSILLAKSPPCCGCASLAATSTLTGRTPKTLRSANTVITKRPTNAPPTKAGHYDSVDSYWCMIYIVFTKNNYRLRIYWFSNSLNVLGVRGGR